MSTGKYLLMFQGSVLDPEGWGHMLIWNLGNYKSSCHNIPEDLNLHKQCFESLKSQVFVCVMAGNLFRMNDGGVICKKCNCNHLYKY